MSDFFCLDENYSTTKNISKIKPLVQVDELFTSKLFLGDDDKRIGEGGLRTNGYYKSSFNTPLITIITAVFNGEKHLEETILSILNQTYDNIELIIIDGGSNDGTLDIIKKYQHAIDYWVSEPDKGISDAFNKGVTLARGDYINFQGDGDGFYAKDSLSQMINNVDPYTDMFISGRIQRVCMDGSEMYVSEFKSKFNKKSLLFRMSIPHQGLLTNIKYFKKYGLFDINNRFCMDYEHLLRAYHDFPKIVVKNVIVAKWRADGLGNNREIDIFREYNKIKVDNKVASIPSLFIINYWTLFKYYIRKIIK
ncbi:glycosyltransferase family 2 protein [Photobacterium damselae]|uniref:glycosyltransferase family 2 protein n=1 Tax=Photobacterium damselae TaxID=38293 RepID=UPI0010FF06C1|nr:glycosyltransferase family 2 protein [Photobacterium damselae]TLS69320.1 glycosyltransferase [Photobacterium damselae subsp. damselae]